MEHGSSSTLDIFMNHGIDCLFFSTASQPHPLSISSSPFLALLPLPPPLPRRWSALSPPTPHTLSSTLPTSYSPIMSGTDNTTDAIDALTQRLKQLALVQTAGNGTTPDTVDKLLSACKAAPTSGLMVGIVIAFTLTTLTLLLGLFEMIRCFINIIGTNRKHREQDAGYASSSALQRWFKSWRWIYALILVIASILEDVHLILYLESTKGIVPREGSVQLSVIAFAMYVIAAILVMVMVIASASKAAVSGQNQSMGSLGGKARRLLCTVVSALGAALALGIAAWVLLSYASAAKALNGGIASLLNYQGKCGQDDACTDNTMFSLISGEIKALAGIDTYIGGSLVCLVVLIIWSSYEVLTIRRREAAEEKNGASYWNAPIDGGHYTVRSYGRSTCGPADRKSKKASLTSEHLAGVPELNRRGSVASTTSWYSSVNSEAMKAPPSYATKSHRSKRSAPAYESEDENDVQTPGAFKTIKGCHLDMAGEFGAALERKYGTSLDSDSDGSSTLSPDSYLADEKLSISDASSSIESDSYIAPRSSHRPKRSRASRSHCGSSLCSQMTVCTASAMAAKHTEVDIRLRAETRDIRWSAALALFAVGLYALILIIKVCIGQEVDLGDRPGFELVLVVWTAVVSNAHLPVLAILMSRGAGFVRDVGTGAAVKA